MLHTRGLNIQNDGDMVYNITGAIIKEAGKRWTTSDGSSQRGNAVKINMKDKVKTQVWDEKNKRVLLGGGVGTYIRMVEIPKFLTLGHELIHEHHEIFPDYSIFYADLEDSYFGRTNYKTNNTYKPHYVFLIPKDVQESKTEGYNGYRTKEIITIGVGNSTIENAEKNGIGTHGEYNLTSDMTENMLREEHRCIGSACGMYKEEQFYYRIAHNTLMLNQFLATPTTPMKGGK